MRGWSAPRKNAGEEKQADRRPNRKNEIAQTESGLAHAIEAAMPRPKNASRLTLMGAEANLIARKNFSLSVARENPTSTAPVQKLPSSSLGKIKLR